MKFRAKRLDNGELVYGMYHTYGDGHFMAEVEIQNNRGDDWKVKAEEIDPTTLAMATGQTDKNGTMIFGSVPVDGVMSRGGDVVRMLYTDWPSKSANDSRTIEQYMYDIGFTAKIQFISPSFYATLQSKFYYDEIDLCSLNVGEHGYILITGKQYEI